MVTIHLTTKRIELESYVCDLQKKVKEYELFLGQKTIALKAAFEKMEDARAEWAPNHLNMKFMKSSEPPTVDIKEYAAIKELLKTSQENYEEAATKARNLSVTCASYRRAIKDANEEIERIKNVLARYGTILQFPGKAA